MAVFNSIAEAHLDYPCDENTYNAILCRSPIIAVKNVCPSFDDMIKWDVGSISAEFVLWMSDDHAQPGATSLVGILSSFAFESMISKFVDSSLSKHLRLLVELTSILYSCGSQASYAGCDLTDLRSLRSFVGTRVLQELELTLGNASLAAASPEKLRALFLVQFATIIAVGYLEPRIPSRDLLASISGLRDYQSPILNESCTSSPSEQVFSEARTQLLRILAHHMVYIAERAGLLDSKGSKKRIIEGSACRWNRRALFQWKEMPAPKDADIRSNVASSQDNTSRADPNMATEYPARCYHLSRSHPIQSSCRPAGGFGACVHEESLNIEPSPMDYILADYKHITSALQDVQAQTEPPASNPLVELQSIRPPHKARRCSSDHHLPSLRARDGNYAAFECLAETDRMCPPFLCTDDDDDNDNNNTINNNETSSTNGTCALKTSQPSTLQHTSIQTPSSSSSTTTTAPASPFQTSSQTPLSTTEATTNTLQNPTACRSCKLEASPFDTLDQNDLCQFCAAFLLPLHDGDDEEEREERKDEEEDGGIEALSSANNNNNNNGDGDVRAEPEVRVRVLEHGSGNGNRDGNGRRGWMVSESGSGRFVV